VIEFPFYGDSGDVWYMYWGTYHWLPLVNGWSGFSPPGTVYLSRAMAAFPDPATTAEKKPLPFDKGEPFRNLGVRRIEARGAALAIDDIELTMRELSGTEGVVQMLRNGESL